MYRIVDVGLSSSCPPNNHISEDVEIPDCAQTTAITSSASLALLQHSLSSMDLNVSPTSPSTMPSIAPAIRPASTSPTAAATSAVPAHRRTLRQRSSSSTSADSANVPATNRRTISRPRKHLSASMSAILAYSLADTADSDGDAPAAITRFYLNANKSARVKPTCLETIEENAVEEDAAAAGGSILLGEHCNFLSVRKRRRSLTFAASAGLADLHSGSRTTSAAVKQLVLRRRRRIKEKLGSGTNRTAGRTATKFSMKVFMERMRALHAEEDETVEETVAMQQPQTPAQQPADLSPSTVEEASA